MRKITAAGTISTVAGSGTACADPTTSCDDGAVATSAELHGRPRSRSMPTRICTSPTRSTTRSGSSRRTTVRCRRWWSRYRVQRPDGSVWRRRQRPTQIYTGRTAWHSMTTGTCTSATPATGAFARSVPTTARSLRLRATGTRGHFDQNGEEASIDLGLSGPSSVWSGPDGLYIAEHTRGSHSQDLGAVRQHSVPRPVPTMWTRHRTTAMTQTEPRSDIPPRSPATTPATCSSRSRTQCAWVEPNGKLGTIAGNPDTPMWRGHRSVWRRRSGEPSAVVGPIGHRAATTSGAQYVADSDHERIRRISPSGSSTTSRARVTPAASTDACGDGGN